MTTQLATTDQQLAPEAIEQVLLNQDLSKLTSQERLHYYQSVCQSLGLNPLTRPFAYIELNKKLTLYALKDCTEQLRKINNVSIEIVSREVTEGIYVVVARATSGTRRDESIGAVPFDKLFGEAKANAVMKCETKAKRRVTLSICGMGMLDETEVGSIPGAVVEPERLGELEQIRKDVAQTACAAAKEDWQSLIPHAGTGKAGGRIFGKTLGELFLGSSLKSAQFYAEHFDTVVIPALQTSNKVDDVKLVSAYGCAKQALMQRLSAETTPASDKTLLSEPAPIVEKPAPLLVEPPPVEKAEARETKKKERNAKALAAAKELTPVKPATLDWRNVTVPFKCKLKGERLGNLPPLDDRSHAEVMALIRPQLIDNAPIFGTTNQHDAMLFKAAYEIAVVEMRIGRSPQEVTAKVRELCEELAVSTEATIEHAEKMGLLPAIGAKIWEKHSDDDKRNIIRNWPDFAASVRENFNLSPK